MFPKPFTQMARILALAAWLVSGCAHPGEDAGAGHSSGGEGAGAPATPLATPPRGPFGLALVASEDGEALDVQGFVSDEECTSCHERHWEELEGSMHLLAHRDPLYRASAELAREEAGEEMFAYCSGCHSPQGLATGLIPGTPESDLPDVVTAGVLCDVCHQISSLTGPTGPWGEPGNASFVLSPDEDRKFGPPGGDDELSDHLVETREFLTGSEFCASCHSVIHPLNGLRLGHTYQEWQRSVYAEKGIQCQDCHMRSVEDARRVAETLEPVAVIGQSEPTGDDREIHPHLFVGANANAVRLGGSAAHAALARKLLASAARLEIEPASPAVEGGALSFDVVVHNVGAGHSLPTSMTELREMWVEVDVFAQDGGSLFRSGQLDASGEIPDGAMRFGTVAADAEGNVTHRPWEIARVLYERLVPAKGSERESFRAALPEGFSGAARVEARLLYRSASPRAVASLMGAGTFELVQVEMARAEATVRVGE